VHIYVDGSFRGQWVASGNRPDVAAFLPAAGPGHGFVAPLNLSRGQHTVCAFGINVGTGRLNQLLACQSVVV
jgi:hypothetical protein